MEQIRVNPKFEADPKENGGHPDDVIYPILYFRASKDHAIYTDGHLVSLLRIYPDPKDPEAFKPGDENVLIAIDDERTVAGLEGILRQLKAMSAWELLSEHFNARNDTYFINRTRDFAAGNGGPPIGGIPNVGQDY